MKDSIKELLEEKIFNLTDQYYQEVHSKKDFIPGTTKVGYAGRVFDQDDMIKGIHWTLD